MKNEKNVFNKTQLLAITGMFSAIIFVLTFTPLGYPQIPLIGSATIIHIPVIVGAILTGPKYGAFLGFMFGLSSMSFASTQSTALNAFAFTPLRPVPGTDSGSLWSLVIAFAPRILVGIIAPLAFYGIAKLIPKIPNAVNMAICAVIASMTNTLLVLHLLYFMFREPWGYARSLVAETPEAIEAAQITYSFIVGIITAFGVPEAILAGIVVPAISVPLMIVAEKRKVASSV